MYIHIYIIYTYIYVCMYVCIYIYIYIHIIYPAGPGLRVEAHRAGDHLPDRGHVFTFLVYLFEHAIHIYIYIYIYICMLFVHIA